MTHSDNRNNQSLNYDIYGYNLVSQKEFVIYANAGDIADLKISENVVAWTNDSDLYLYDLTTRTLSKVASLGGQPAISKAVLVWTQWDKPNDRNAHSQVAISYLSSNP